MLPTVAVHVVGHYSRKADEIESNMIFGLLGYYDFIVTAFIYVENRYINPNYYITIITTSAQ